MAMNIETLNLLADAISDVGAWWCWYVGDDMVQVEFRDIQLYDEAEEEESYESDYDQDYESESAESGEETFDSVDLEEAADQEPEGFNLFETEEPNQSVTEEAVIDEADAEETVIEDESLKEADQSPFLFGGDSEEEGINPDTAETGWMTEDEDLVLNPALFALADEMSDPDETETLDESPDGYRTGDETVEAYDENGAAFAYKNEEEKSDDLYFKVSKDGVTYNFCVEFYLCGQDTDVYKAVEALNVGDVIDVEAFLYWYEGANPHTTAITVVTPAAEAAAE